jgi:hypothetical protein
MSFNRLEKEQEREGELEIRLSLPKSKSKKIQNTYVNVRPLQQRPIPISQVNVGVHIWSGVMFTL